MNITPDFKYFKNDYVDAIKHNYFKPVLDAIFTEYGGNIKNMCDVGCGNGIFASYLKNCYGVKLHGIDGSDHALRCSSGNGFDSVSHNADFSHTPLNVSDNNFDFIMCKDVLEHLIDPCFLMREIARVLKNGGLCLLHVPNDFNLWKRIIFVFKNNVDTYNYFPGAKEWNRPHIRFFSADGFDELIRHHGLEIVRTFSALFSIKVPLIYRVPFYSHIINWLAGRYPSHFAQAFTILARKV